MSRERIARPIGRADLEHYEGHLVLITAQAMAKASPEAWNAFSRRRRVRWIERSLDVLTTVLGDSLVVEKLPMLTKSLQERR